MGNCRLSNIPVDDVRGGVYGGDVAPCVEGVGDDHPRPRRQGEDVEDGGGQGGVGRVGADAEGLGDEEPEPGSKMSNKDWNKLSGALDTRCQMYNAGMTAVKKYPN